MNSIRLLYITLFFLSTSTVAQTTTQKEAEQQFENFSFVKAIDSYKKIIGTNYNDDNAMRNLGDAYIMIRQPEKALPIYEQVVKQKNVPSKYYLYYAQTLRANGQYEASKEWMKKYKDAGNQDDDYVKYFFKNEDLASGIFNARVKYELEKVDFNSKFNDFGAVVVDDNVVFTSSRDEGVSVKRIYGWDGQPMLDLYQTPRSGNSNHSTKKLEGDVNTIEHDGPATFSSDGTKMYFSRNNFINNKKINSYKGVMLVGIYSAELVNGLWTNVKPSSLNNANYMVYQPALSQDGKKLYFTSDMPGGFGGTDIYVTEVSQDGTLGIPKNLGNVVNTEKNESFPFIHSKENTLYFSSDGHIGKGLLDIFLAVQDNDNIVNVINLGAPVNTEKDDFAYYLSADGLSGFISSNRKGGMGGDDIYSFTRNPKLTLKGLIFNALNGEPLTDTKLILARKNGEKGANFITKADGTYEYTIDRDSEFILKGSKPQYRDLQREISSFGLAKESIINLNIPMSPIEDAKILKGLVFDAINGEPLAGVKLILAGKNGEKGADFITKTDGTYEYVLAPDNEFILKGSKSKYDDLQRKITSFGLEKGSIINLNIPMSPIEDVIILADLNTIYFDLDKSNIRPDAAFELDKVVTLLNKYPGMIIRLESHTDSRGDAKYNMALSSRRARSTNNYIVSRGINQKRIRKYEGFGESQLINKCSDGVYCTDEQHQLNRRTEFIILKMK